MHTSSPRGKGRQPRFKSVKAEALGLTTRKKVNEYAKSKFPDYNAAQLQGLEEMYDYTPEQLEAVKAGEETVRPRDMALQGRVRDDKARLPYLDDFSAVKPVIDQKPERHLEAEDYTFLSEQEFIDKLFEKMMDKSTENMQGAAAAAFRSSVKRVQAAHGLELDLTTKELEDMETWPELRERFVMSPEEEELSASKLKAQDEAAVKSEGTLSTEETRQMLEDLVDDFSAKLDAAAPNEASSELFAEQERLGVGTSGEAPPLGKVPGVEGLYKHAQDPEDEGLDDEGAYQHLKKVTGMSVRDILSVYTKVLVTRFVVNQTRLGKVRSASVMVIAGNGNGRLGVGTAKSADFSTAATAARMLAIRNMRPIRRYEDRTIYGTVREKVSGTIVELRSRPPGTFPFPFHSFPMEQAKLTKAQASASASPPASSKCAAPPASTTSPASSRARATP